MKIAIIGAMEEEITLLRSQMTYRRCYELAACKIYTGKLHGAKIALLQSGIGKVAAAIGTTLLINKVKPTYIINTGSAGGLASSLNVGDIVVSQEVCYHDVDVTAFGYQYGQLPGCPARFSSDEHLVNIAECCIKQLNLNAARGLICSGDAFINGAQPLATIQKNFPDVAAVEMEAAAIAHTCHKFTIPFVVVRAISDVADKQSHISFDEFLPIAAKQSSLMVSAMVKALV